MPLLLGMSVGLVAVTKLNNERDFWQKHLVFPLLAFIPLLSILELSSIDLWLADALYTWEGGAWGLKKNWLVYGIMHHDGKQLIYLVGFVALLLAGSSRKVTALRPFRGSIFYLLICMAIIPTGIAFVKHFSQVPCPWSLVNYGANRIYQHNLSYPLGFGRGEHCFPSGHASGGYAVLALYFAAYPHVTKNAWRFLLPGILLGTSFGLAQQLRGAHFLSHDLWTAFFCWFLSLLIFSLFRSRSGKLPQVRSFTNETC
jgi:membrane-associated PAP2 superfamily phosphatase